MKFGPAVTLTLRRYAVFAGRASRSECWWFVVFNLGIGLAAATVGNAMQDPDALRALSLLVLLPWITLAVRRLHDIDRTGWWVLLGLLPVIGTIGLLVLFCIPGTPGGNRFGQSTDPSNDGQSSQAIA